MGIAMTRLRRIVLAASLLGVSSTARADPPGLGGHVEDAERAAEKHEADAGPQEAPNHESEVARLQDLWRQRLGELGAGPEGEAPEISEEKARGALSASASLPTVVRIFRARNPDLRAAGARVRAEIESITQVAWIESVVSRYAAFLREARGGAVPGDMPGASFPAPGLMELRSQVVDRSVAVALAEAHRIESRLLAKVRTQYIQWRYWQDALALSDESLGWHEQLERAARAHFEAGHGDKAHLLQAQAGVARHRTEQVIWRAKQDDARVQLLSLMALPAETPLASPPTSAAPPLPAPRELQTVAPEARENAPTATKATAMAARMQAMLELAQRMARPQLSTGLSLPMPPSAANTGSDRPAGAFPKRPGTAPDQWLGAADRWLAELRLRVEAATHSATAAADAAELEARLAHSASRTAQDRLTLLTQTEIPLADEARADAQAGYSAGRLSFADVVSALRRWLATRQAALEAERDLRLATVRLEAALGER